MIFHASIPADEPERVARVLASLWKTDYFPFVFPDSYIVIADDDRGTEIEVCRRGYQLVPAAAEVGLANAPSPSAYNEVHLNIATPLSVEEVLELAQREGWIARICDRKFFNLVEFWIENRFLLELVPDEEAARYRSFMSCANWRQFLAHETMPVGLFGFTETWLTAANEH